MCTKGWITLGRCCFVTALGEGIGEMKQPARIVSAGHGGYRGLRLYVVRLALNGGIDNGSSHSTCMIPSHPSKALLRRSVVGRGMSNALAGGKTQCAL